MCARIEKNFEHIYTYVKRNFTTENNLHASGKLIEINLYMPYSFHKLVSISHYELQCYENPMKMSLKTQESFFQGPEYRYFIFMAYFSGPEFAMKS